MHVAAEAVFACFGCWIALFSFSTFVWCQRSSYAAGLFSVLALVWVVQRSFVVLLYSCASPLSKRVDVCRIVSAFW